MAHEVKPMISPVPLDAVIVFVNMGANQDLAQLAQEVREFINTGRREAGLPEHRCFNVNKVDQAPNLALFESWQQKIPKGVPVYAVMTPRTSMTDWVKQAAYWNGEKVAFTRHKLYGVNPVVFVANAKQRLKLLLDHE